MRGIGIVAALALAGCGGEGGQAGNSSSPAAPAATPPPQACKVLEQLDLATLLGGAATLTEQTNIDNPQTALSQCIAQAGSRTASLQLRYDKGAPRPATEQRVTMRASFDNKELYSFPNGPEAEEVAIGDAALWVGGTGQLIIWHQGGRAQSIVTVDMPSARNRKDAETLGRALVARYP
jgi:hypothetical protein